MGERGLTYDTLITLQQAVDYAFVDGGCSVATLKAEAAKGNLEVSKIGRSYFTTLAKIKAMDAKCLVQAPARASGSIRKEEHGLSSTVEAEAARGSLLMNLDRLKKPSENTSRRSMSSKTAPRRSSQTY